VAETVDAWVKFNECPAEPAVTHVADKAGDGTTINIKIFGPGKGGAEVVFVEVVGGGHTWPGREPPVKFIGKSTKNISANDMIWEFFERHAMK
jgi:polyhydroxybutyrate depolymerase